MATRGAGHAAASDASPTPSNANLTTPSGSAFDGPSNAVGPAPPLAAHVALAASAYDPSPSISAFANAAAVAASTAVLTSSSASDRSRATALSSSSSSPLSTQVAPSPSHTLPIMAATPPPRSKLVSGRPSSKFGTVNYSIDEMRRLNDKVRAVMPIASDDWLHVAYQFNYMRPESIPYREVESLKRKFKKMYCTRSSPGGKLPDYAQDAKELRRQINQRSERAQLQVESSVQSDSQSEIDATDVVTTPATGTQDEAAMAEAPDETLVAASGTMEADMPGETVADDATRDIAARLRLMEDEYHRSMGAKRGSASCATSVPSPGEGLGVPALYTESAFATSPGGLHAPMVSADTTTTTGIINLLKHSIERKRRTIEEQMLSESERVRKERKKRKMEQVLYNIHREQTGGSVAPTESAASLSSGGTAAAFQHNLLAAATAASPSTPSAASTDASSLGLMELVLQFMVTQQQETMHRVQQENERRRIEAVERERRRRLKDAQRRNDKHEMMLVMAALLQDNFPGELRQYLEPEGLAVEETSTSSSSATPNGSIPKAKAAETSLVDDETLL